MRLKKFVSFAKKVLHRLFPKEYKELSAFLQKAIETRKAVKLEKKFFPVIDSANPDFSFNEIKPFSGFSFLRLEIPGDEEERGFFHDIGIGYCGCISQSPSLHEKECEEEEKIRRALQTFHIPIAV